MSRGSSNTRPRSTARGRDQAPAGPLYVYCLIRSARPIAFGRLGLGPLAGEVRTEHWRELAAVVSDVPAGTLPASRDHVLAHQRVNETVMREHTVLPMSFGTTFGTRDDLLEFLRSAYESFMDVIDRMEEKLEFGLKVLWNRDAVARQIEAEDADLGRVRAALAAQRGSTYLARLQYDRLLEAALQARAERHVADISDALRDVAVAWRSNRPVGTRMIMNAAFLVSRQQEAAFDARVKEIGARWEALTLRYTGPWPPYNFVNIRLTHDRS